MDQPLKEGSTWRTFSKRVHQAKQNTLWSSCPFCSQERWNVENVSQMCVDYKAIIKVTLKNKYPLPHIDGLFTSLWAPKCLVRWTYIHGIGKFKLQKEMKKNCFVTQGMAPMSFWWCLLNSPTCLPWLHFMNDIFWKWLGENMVKRTKGTEVKVLFQGSHMTHDIFVLVYNFKFCILNTLNPMILWSST